MTPDEIKKQVLFELAIQPFAFLALFFFSIMFIASLVIGTPLTFAISFFGALATIGCMATKVLLNIDEDTKKAIENHYAREESLVKYNKERELNSLHSKLVKIKGNRPKRDENYLAELRSAYNFFLKDVQSGNVSSFITDDVLRQTEELVDACVHSLKYSYQVYCDAMKARGKTKQQLLAEREEVLDEVEISVQRLVNTISSLRALKRKADRDDFDLLHKELDASLEVARRTEERVAALELGRQIKH